jgi:myo-inositol-hexaphosphate 3-phosphohydrolase
MTPWIASIGAALALAAAGCTNTTPTVTPEEAEAIDDDVEGTPTDIEDDEIGDDQADDAEAVEPGPAELEVGEPNEFGTPP